MHPEPPNAAGDPPLDPFRLRGHRFSPWLAFESSELEDQYWQERRPIDRARAAIFVILSMATFLVFAFSDHRLFGPSRQLILLLAVRALFLLTSVFALVVIFRASRRRHLHWTLLLWSLMGLAAGAYIVSSRPLYYTGHALPCLAFVLAGYLMIPSPWLFQAIPGFLIAACYIALCFWLNPPVHELSPLALATSFLAVNLLGCAWSMQSEHWKRRQFAALHREMELRGRLERALAEIRTLRGLVPICCHCKRIRDEAGLWHQIEAYVRDHTHADFTHGICPDCLTVHHDIRVPS
jgi:hypothetical protein